MKKLLYILLSLGLTIQAFSQDKYFDVQFDYKDTDIGRSVVKQNDDYLVALVSNLNADSNWDRGFVRFSNLGTVENSQIIESTVPSTVHTILDINNNVFVCGSIWGNEIHDNAIAGLNIFNEDTLLNSIQYNSNPLSVSSVYDMTQIEDNKIILAGFKSSDYQAIAANVKIEVICVDTLGAVLWDTVYTQYNRARIWNVTKANDEGCFYAVGSIDLINGPGPMDEATAILMKIDSVGTILWDKQIPQSEAGEFLRLTTTSDGHILVHYLELFGMKAIIKFDSLGNIVWVTDYAYDQGFTSGIKESQDGNYLTASSIVPEFGQLMGNLRKLDTDGNILWERWYGTPDDDDYIYDMLVEEDGSIVMCGRKESGVEIGADVWLLKTNCLGLFTEPQSNFNYQANETNVLFENLSQFVYPDSIDGGHYLWDFGDGSTSEEINPVHIYEVNTAYEVTLTAIVCQDTSVYSTCVYLEENSLCCVEVEASPIPAFSLETTDSLSISLENISSNLYEEYTNGARVLWDFGDGNISTEISPNHTFAEANYYDVTLSVILCGDTTSVFETVKVGEPVGIEMVNNNEVSIYPNPATTSVTITYKIDKRETFFLYNTMGQLLKEVELDQLSNSQIIATEFFVEGIYYWRLENKNGKLLIR